MALSDDEITYDDMNLSDSEQEIATELLPEQEPAQPETKPTRSRGPEYRFDDAESREGSLRAELENVRKMNKVIEDVIESLEKARNNMGTVSRTLHNATTLLNSWTRILSQSEHNQRLILNPAWHGASHDLASIENETHMRQQAALYREAEEQARREAAARRAEDEERRRAEGAAKPTTTRGGRTRGRGSISGKTTPSSTSGTSYVGFGGQSGRGARGSGIARGSSGIGRAGRGRGRGVG